MAKKNCYQPMGNERQVTPAQIQPKGSVACGETVIVNGTTAVEGACNRERVPLSSPVNGAHKQPRGPSDRSSMPVCGR